MLWMVGLGMIVAVVWLVYRYSDKISYSERELKTEQREGEVVEMLAGDALMYAMGLLTVALGMMWGEQEGIKELSFAEAIDQFEAIRDHPWYVMEPLHFRLKDPPTEQNLKDLGTCIFRVEDQASAGGFTETQLHYSVVLIRLKEVNQWIIIQGVLGKQEFFSFVLPATIRSYLEKGTLRIISWKSSVSGSKNSRGART